MGNNTSSPFKFLSPYLYNDRNVYFGRDREIEMLYELMFQTPMAVVYGLSGTGKTSLIACGLANRFNGPDWLPVFVRRDEDINESLQFKLQKKLGASSTWTGVNDAVKTLFNHYWKPVYLIFDQFEEVFTCGNKPEREAFAKQLRTLLDAHLKCKILIVIREEYLGRLKELEPLVPEIADYTFRVEPMNDEDVQEVILRSCHSYNITLEPSEEDRCKEIINNLKNEPEEAVHLPHLQIYLNLLYEDDFANTYKNRDELTPTLEISKDEYRPLEFRADEISRFGKIDVVLERFFSQQEKEIVRSIKTKNSKEAELLVATLLELMVTVEGTRKPVFYDKDESGKMKLRDKPDSLKDFTDTLIFDVFELLEDRKLIHRWEEPDNKIELSHETLAKHVDTRRARIREAKNKIEAYYQEWRDTGGKNYLSKSQLRNIREIMGQVAPLLSPEVIRFVEKSKIRAKWRILGWFGLGMMALCLVLISLAYLKSNSNIAELAQSNKKLVDKALWPKIYKMEYLDTRDILDITQTPENNCPSVTSIYFELAYFFNESGHVGLAKNCLDSMLSLDFKRMNRSTKERLDLRISKSQSDLRKYLKNLDPARFDSVEIKYFPQMILVKGGNFLFGSKENAGFEMPAQMKDFYIAQTELTMHQYAIFIAQHNLKLDTLMNNWQMRGDAPVTHVNWYDAVRYANWLSRRFGYDEAYIISEQTGNKLPFVTMNPDAKTCYRLPYELEWEYAAKGGQQQQPYAFAGSHEADSVAWYNENSKISDIARPQSVAQKKANTLGLFDMSGNVWEWCNDYYADNKSVKINKDKLRTGPVSGPKLVRNVIRGGSFQFDKTSSWVFTRGAGYPEKRQPSTGFRVVLVEK